MRLSARIVDDRIEVYDVATGEAVEGVYKANVAHEAGGSMEVSVAFVVMAQAAPGRPLGRSDFLSDVEDEEPAKPRVPRTL